MDALQTHRDLVERCRKGQRDAPFELYRLYSRAMYNTARRMVQQRIRRKCPCTGRGEGLDALR